MPPSKKLPLPTCAPPTVRRCPQGVADYKVDVISSAHYEDSVSVPRARYSVYRIEQRRGWFKTHQILHHLCTFFSLEDAEAFIVKHASEKHPAYYAVYR